MSDIPLHAEPPPAAEASALPPQTSALALLWLLTGFIALQPLGTDVYLPSLPGLARVFDAPIATVQLTLSVFIAGFGVAQLFAGPLSDRYGRLPVVSGGVALYLAACIGAMLAPSIEWLIGCRFVQAVGACSGLVAARAIIRDSFTPADGARMLARANSLMAAVPILGPLTGAFLETRFGFRAIFALLAVLSAALLLFARRRLRETNPFKNPDALKLHGMLDSYRIVAATPAFWAYALVQTASYAGLFAFLSGSSFVMMKILGLSAQQYGLAFTGAVLGFLAGSLTCQRVLPRLGLQRTLYAAAMLSLCGGTLMIALALAEVRHPLAIVVPQFVFLCGHGMLTPCSQAGAVAPFPERAGAAAALMGFVLATVAAGIGTWIGRSYNGTVHPLTTTVFASSLAVAFVVFVLVRRHGNLARD